MSGVTLPAIPGAVPLYTRSLPNGFDSSRSRPSSSGSQCSAYSIVPHVYYDHCSFRTPGYGNTPGIPRAYSKLPSLRTGRKSGYNPNTDIRARYSAKFRKTPDPFKNKLTADSPFLNKSTVEDCLKCLLKVPHKRCESHKYIRVGGGYRHGYWYVKCLLEELELQRQRELILKQRLESIREKNVKAIKTYIRTKSGRLVERIIFLSEEDYAAFKEGKNVQDILKKYLSKDEAQGLESWDKDEVKAIKTYVRTKSGRLVEKLVYVSKEDYDAITQGKGDAKALLKKYAKDGEVIEGWDEAKMKTIKTYVRTKSGRLIEKTIMISQEDYDAMIRDGKDPAEILKKYMPLGDGETLESWKSAEPMKAIKTMVRTKSGRLIEKTVYVSADDYERLQKGDADLNDILGKYMGEDGGTVEGWKKADPTPMKVVKTYIRTKSGRLIEKQVLLTEEEYKQFMESGGNPDFLKKFIELEKGEVIDSWEKASTVFSGEDDEEIKNAKEGQRIVGKDGTVYEVVVDPLTGKKYKKKVGKQSDIDSGFESMQKGKGGRGRKGLGKGEIDHEETAEERRARKQGKRDAGSDSEYSYKSVYSAGGTRHVRRRRKRADGTRSGSESYHSDQDADGEARRRRRRREREHAGSAHSYYSVTSEGGTRHVMRRRKREDGTYSDPESYHSADSFEAGGRMADKKKKEKEKKEKKTKQNRGGEDSDHSYYSETSEGGTRRTLRKKKIRDAHGNVIGYEKPREYDEDEISVYTEVSDGKGGKMKVKKENPNSKKAKAKAAAKEAAKAKLKQKYGKDFDPVFSDCTTDDDDVDLENMTEEEKKAYFEGKAKRAAEREKRRREKYGDKYDEMMSKHQEQKKLLEKEKKKAAKLAELREKGLISPSSDWTIDSDTGEPLRKKAKEKVKQERKEQIKRKKLQEAREKGLISPSSDWTLDSDGEPARRSDLVKQGKRPPPEKGKGKKKGKDGNEADDESEEGKGRRGSKLLKKKRGSVAGLDTARSSKKGGAGKGGSKKGKLAGKEKAAFKAGKRNNDSDSDYSYRSVVSAGGTRHVRRRKKNADGTYGDSESYHSSQDEDGEARRRKRRRDREHGDDSDHSYYSVISAGGTRHVRRRKRNPDGTYGDSESYHSGDTDPDLKRELTKTTKTTEESDSDYSYASERSVGGTRYEVKRKRLRDAAGKVIGHGDKVVLGEAVSDADSVRTRRGSIEEGNEPPTHVKDVLNDANVTLQKRGIGSIGDISTAGLDDLIKRSKWPGEGLERIASQLTPDEFSDTTTDDNVDLSKMTEEEREAYLRNREKRRAAREKRRREKYGDKYDEIMKKREQKRFDQLKKEEDEKREGADKLGVGSRRSSMRRASTNLDKDKIKDRPKSMVTYEKGPPRDLGHNQKIDNREIGLSHESWAKDKNDKSRRGSSDSSADNPRRMLRESTILNKLPSIPQGKMFPSDRRGKRGDGRGNDGSTLDGEDSTFVGSENTEDRQDGNADKERAKSPVLERGADGKLRPKKKKININDLDADTLRKLGIDPNLSKKEIAKKLKELFGDDMQITDGENVIGTKGIDEFDQDMTDEQLAAMEDLDLSTVTGKRRVNILFQRGGSALRRHFERILKACKLREEKAKDIDERDSSIDFLNHYRLVDPMNLDGYAKAFVVEDTDYDTVLNSSDTKVALDGIEMLQHLTEKQLDYVFKVLHIDEASQVTFKMFAVITALCERVTNMDELSKHLLDICNLGDVERKLELYKAMFYHNIPSYRDTNYVTSDSLKIELIAGGLNWKQQEFVMEKLEPSRYGEISFLDYMCYIPLFLSMHDNICYNPLDMSNKKYQMPPRKRPPSAQRDMNPLGQRLKKTSDFLMKRLAKEVAEGKINEDILQPEERELLKKYAVLPDIRNILKTEREETADEMSFKDLIY
nr:zinc finger CCCH domain-containing protein 13 isoform X1 [Crassostrea gigas]